MPGDFGLSSTPSSAGNTSTQGLMHARTSEQLISAPSGEEIVKVSFYGDLASAGSHTLVLDVFQLDTGAADSADLLGSGNSAVTVDSTTAAWWETGTLSLALVSGEDYACAYTQSNSTIRHYYNWIGSASMSRQTAFGSTDNPWVEAGTLDYVIGMFADYAATGGGGGPDTARNLLVIGCG